MPCSLKRNINLQEENIRPLSYTQISTYLSCPLSYKLRYIDKLKPKVKWYFSFGNSLHSSVEYFFRVNTPPPPSLEELLAYYSQIWQPYGYKSAEEEQQYRAYGEEILTRFWEVHSVDFRMPIAVEKSFTVDIEGVKLKGYIDRIDKLESGSLSIVDYKSGKELFTSDYLENDLQLTFYQLAAEETWQLPVEKLTLYHLRSNTPCTCPPREPSRLDDARGLILDVAENITGENFPATENRFCPCDFPEYCPYYRHLYMEVSLARQEQLPGIAITEVVDRYASLQAQIKELEAQLAEAKRIINEFCEAEGLNRVYGDEYEITSKIIERTGFSEEEVKILLEPEGLWEKLVRFDTARLNEMLRNREIPDDIKQKLETLRRITSSYQQLRVRKRAEESDEEDTGEIESDSNETGGA